MNYRGLIWVADNDISSAIEATVTVTDRGELSIRVKDDHLGSWSRSQVKVEPRGDSDFRLTMESDHIVFRPDTPTGRTSFGRAMARPNGRGDMAGGPSSQNRGKAMLLLMVLVGSLACFAYGLVRNLSTYWPPDGYVVVEGEVIRELPGGEGDPDSEVRFSPAPDTQLVFHSDHSGEVGEVVLVAFDPDNPSETRQTRRDFTPPTAFLVFGGGIAAVVAGYELWKLAKGGRRRADDATVEPAE